jgi:hypothetical protein
MTSVFIEATVLFQDRVSVEGGAAGGRGGDRPEVLPRAALEAIETLRESGHAVAVLRPAPTPGAGRPAAHDGPEGLDEVAEGPGQPPSGSWLVTVDPRRCEHRPPGVRTILVGPRRPPGPRPTAHCDIEARDLAAAVMEILTREAMA